MTFSWQFLTKSLTTMAVQSKNPAEGAPFGALRDETVTHLDKIKGELDEAVKDLDALEEIGMDVTRLRERVNWGYKAREIILKRYGRKA